MIHQGIRIFQPLFEERGNLAPFRSCADAFARSYVCAKPRVPVVICPRIASASRASAVPVMLRA